MRIEKENKIEEYIRAVCTQVKFKEAHENIKLELQDHMFQLKEDYLQMGIPEEKAEERAIKEMGDAVLVGKQLHKANRPRVEWSIVFFTMLLSIVGITLQVVLIHNGLAYNFLSKSILYNGIAFSGLGIIIAVILYFINYSRIEKYSYFIYGLALIFPIIDVFNIIPLSYVELYYRIAKFASPIEPFMFSLCFAGIFNNYDWKDNTKKAKALILVALPIVPLFKMGIGTCIIYIIATFAVLKSSGLKVSYLLGANSILGIITYILLVFAPSKEINQLKVFFNIKNWGFIQIRNLIGSAGLFGNGFTSQGNKLLLNFYEIHINFIFGYIVYTFGWAIASLLIVFIFTFLYKLIKTTRKANDTYGKLITTGFTTILLVESIWYILMNLGCAPYGGIGLPFISYGASASLINMAAVGLILSVYRRKDIKQLNIIN